MNELQYKKKRKNQTTEPQIRQYAKQQSLNNTVF